MNQNNNRQGNERNNRPSQGVPGASNNSSSFPNNTPKKEKGIKTPGHSSSSFQDSLNRKPNSSFKDDIKDKATNFIPGVRQAKKISDLANKTNNALSNIRANKGPQLPPNRANNNTHSNTIPKANNPLSKPSFLPKGKNLLDDDETDNTEDAENQSAVSTLIGRKNNKNNKGGLSFLGSGFLKMNPIVKLFAVVLAIMIPLLLFFMAMSPILVFNSTSAIGISDSNKNYKTTEAEKDFQERVKEVQDEYSSDGKSFEAKYIGAVYTILSTYGKGYSYKKMTKSKIREIADLMFDENNSFSEDTFKNNLINNYFPSKIPGQDENTYKRYVKDMYDILKYYDNNNKSSSQASTGATGDVCTYNFPGMNTEQYGTGIKNRAINATNIMVRLMSAGGMCDGTYGVPIEGEDLVPLEKYILGVAYAEVDDYPEQAFKAQLVAARSFILAVADASGNGGGRKLAEENGQWILQITNCVTDQVYCDPDQGCSKNGNPKNQYLVVHSGMKASNKYKDPMPANDQRRQWASEVAGKIALDSSGRLYMTNFASNDQDAYLSLAGQGYDYTQIIMKHYPNVASISESNCVDSSSTTSGNYAAWKQTDSQWSSVVLGGGTDKKRSIGNIGCLATSISMLIAKSGAVDSITDSAAKANFNPGTFVEAMNNVGGFDSAGNLQWYKVSDVAPSFKYADDTSLKGLSKSEKLSTIKEKTSQSNTYCVAEVKGDQGQHWVAIDSVSNDGVKMMDPGSKATDLWQQYDWNNTSRLTCFKKN